MVCIVAAAGIAWFASQPQETASAAEKAIYELLKTNEDRAVISERDAENNEKSLTQRS